MCADFKFVLLTDTCLTDRDIVSEIKAADKEIGFDCAVHLGNIINGNNPEKISDRIYAAEAEKYRNCTAVKKLYVSQGKTDGYRNERFLGQLAVNITSDEKWTGLASFVEENGNARLFGKPYYYADFPDKRIRMIFLCPYVSQLDEENEIYVKFEGFDAPQIAWLMNVASNVEKGWRVCLFSHSIPKSSFSGDEPFLYKGRSTDPFLRAVQYINEKGARVAAHFCGSYGKNKACKTGGINRISVADLWQTVEIGENFVSVNGEKYEF